MSFTKSAVLAVRPARTFAIFVRTEKETSTDPFHLLVPQAGNKNGAVTGAHEKTESTDALRNGVHAVIAAHDGQVHPQRNLYIRMAQPLRLTTFNGTSTEQ